MQKYADHTVDHQAVFAWYQRAYGVDSLQAMLQKGYVLYHSEHAAREQLAQLRIATDLQHLEEDPHAEDAIPDYVLYIYAEQQGWIH